MANPLKLSSNSESQLGKFGLHHVGFEHYDGPKFEVKGLRSSDYRWMVTDKGTGELRECCSLIERVQFIERSGMAQKEPKP